MFSWKSQVPWIIQRWAKLTSYVSLPEGIYIYMDHRSVVCFTAVHQGDEVFSDPREEANALRHRVGSWDRFWWFLHGEKSMEIPWKSHGNPYIYIYPLWYPWWFHRDFTWIKHTRWDLVINHRDDVSQDVVSHRWKFPEKGGWNCGTCKSEVIIWNELELVITRILSVSASKVHQVACPTESDQKWSGETVRGPAFSSRPWCQVRPLPCDLCDFWALPPSSGGHKKPHFAVKTRGFCLG